MITTRKMCIYPWDFLFFFFFNSFLALYDTYWLVPYVASD